MSQKSKVLKRGNAKKLTKISVLAAIATVLMLIEFPLWFAPDFLAKRWHYRRRYGWARRRSYPLRQ